MSINKVTISIQMDNAAFDPDRWGEVARILRKFAARVDSMDLPVTLVDTNGNSCGTVVYDEVK